MNFIKMFGSFERSILNCNMENRRYMFKLPQIIVYSLFLLFSFLFGVLLTYGYFSKINGSFLPSEIIIKKSETDIIVDFPDVSFNTASEFQENLKSAMDTARTNFYSNEIIETVLTNLKSPARCKLLYSNDTSYKVIFMSFPHEGYTLATESGLYAMFPIPKRIE